MKLKNNYKKPTKKQLYPRTNYMRLFEQLEAHSGPTFKLNKLIVLNTWKRWSLLCYNLWPILTMFFPWKIDHCIMPFSVRVRLRFCSLEQLQDPQDGATGTIEIWKRHSFLLVVAVVHRCRTKNMKYVFWYHEHPWTSILVKKYKLEYSFENITNILVKNYKFMTSLRN